MSDHGDIVDLDQLDDNGVTKKEDTSLKVESSAEKSRGKKKGASVKKSGPRQKDDITVSNFGSFASNSKLSREERKVMNAMMLFEKMEQKNRRAGIGGRKKRKTDDDKSQKSADPDNDESVAQDDIEKSINENTEISSTKSETASSMVDKSPSSRKTDQSVKVGSKFFNNSFNLSGSSSLISYLFQYQKDFGQKYKTKKDLNAKPKKPENQSKGNNDVKDKSMAVEPLPKFDLNKHENIRKAFKEMNEKFKEHAKSAGTTKPDDANNLVFTTFANKFEQKAEE